jgi:hypothetical protein
MPDGTFRHASIGAARQEQGECAVGWIAHYSIGGALAVGFVAIVGREWLARPAALPAIAYGIVTIVFPFFLMQPSLGLGIAGSRTPAPAKARLKSLATHAVFGAGLYLCALALAR